MLLHCIIYYEAKSKRNTNRGFKSGQPHVNNNINPNWDNWLLKLAIQQESHLTPFLFALKTSETKRQYSRNLKLFFDFGLDASLSLSDQANIFAKKALNDSNWATNYFMQFFQFQVENRLKTTNETKLNLSVYNNSKMKIVPLTENELNEATAWQLRFCFGTLY